MIVSEVVVRLGPTIRTEVADRPPSFATIHYVGRVGLAPRWQVPSASPPPCGPLSPFNEALFQNAPAGILAPLPQAALYHAFVDDWQDFGTTGNLAAAEVMSARTLLIHDWRRIVLRDPALPDALLPAGWIGHEAHKLVRQTYHDLLHGSENWLNDNGLPAQTRPGALKQRFNVLRNIAK